MPPDGTLEQKFALRHKVTFLPGSVFEEIFCKKEINVNSLHGQGIDQPGQRVSVDGFAPDGTPEAMEPLLEKKLDGFGEIFRALSFEEIGTSALQSRAMAGVVNGTYVFCLPGSSGACATAWDKILQFQLDYRTRPCNLVELMPRLLEHR